MGKDHRLEGAKLNLWTYVDDLIVQQDHQNKSVHIFNLKLTLMIHESIILHPGNFFNSRPIWHIYLICRIIQA